VIEALFERRDETYNRQRDAKHDKGQTCQHHPT
jgi:hypothetical protein